MLVAGHSSLQTHKKHRVESSGIAWLLDEYGACMDCGKPFEEVMGSCRACGSEREPTQSA